MAYGKLVKNLEAMGRKLLGGDWRQTGSLQASTLQHPAGLHSREVWKLSLGASEHDFLISRPTSLYTKLALQWVLITEPFWLPKGPGTLGQESFLHLFSLMNAYSPDLRWVFPEDSRGWQYAAITGYLAAVGPLHLPRVLYPQGHCH